MPDLLLDIAPTSGVTLRAEIKVMTMYFTRMKLNRVAGKPDAVSAVPYWAWGQGVFFAAVFAVVLAGFLGMVAGANFDFSGALEDHIDAIEAGRIPCPIHDGMVHTLEGPKYISDPS
ncbi:hypothetical protein SAMN04488117_101404 [Celeribacter baekdonensis]|uniref:Uncharacterized protein n=2 Tax=Celeribacter baekdonensis TaxID=875171 RepID=A0A1G7G5V2_9RHOB|nr:hypothetical protein SAMN04488117_101404 [Celeribacter baekdonensis]